MIRIILPIFTLVLLLSSSIAKMEKNSPEWEFMHGIYQGIFEQAKKHKSAKGVQSQLDKLHKRYPDPQARLHKVYDYNAATGGMLNNQILKRYWTHYAEVDERSKFLVNKINTVPAKIEGSEFDEQFYVQEILMAEIALPHISKPEYRDLNDLSIEAEARYQGNNSFLNLIRSEQGINERVAALWFEEAPEQALIASLDSMPDSMRTRLDEIKRIRIDVDKTVKSTDEIVHWTALQAKLLELWNTNIPTVQAYVAGIVSKNYRSPHRYTPLLAKEMEKSDSPLIHYLLSKRNSKYNVTLSDLSGTEKIKLRYDNPSIVSNSDDKEEEAVQEEQAEQIGEELVADAGSDSHPMKKNLPTLTASQVGSELEEETTKASALPIALIGSTLILGILLLIKVRASRS